MGAGTLKTENVVVVRSFMSALFVWHVVQRFMDFFSGVKKNSLDNTLFISWLTFTVLEYCDILRAFHPEKRRKTLIYLFNSTKQWGHAVRCDCLVGYGNFFIAQERQSAAHKVVTSMMTFLFPLLFLQCHIWHILPRLFAHTRLFLLLHSQSVQVLICEGWQCFILLLLIRAERVS